MRAAVEVSPATGEDLPLVAALAAEARSESSAGVQVCSPDADRLVRHLSVLLALPGGHVLVARDESAVLGFVLARDVQPNLFADKPALYVEALYVAEAARRRGVGHALLTAVADLAEASSATEVYSVPIPGARGVQRFLARLGFAPAAGHRVVATATLRRRLGGEAPAGRRGARSIEDLIARRRRTRSEMQTGPVDLRDFQAQHAAASQADGGPVAASR